MWQPCIIYIYIYLYTYIYIYMYVYVMGHFVCDCPSSTEPSFAEAPVSMQLSLLASQSQGCTSRGRSSEGMGCETLTKIVDFLMA